MLPTMSPTPKAGPTSSAERRPLLGRLLSPRPVAVSRGRIRLVLTGAIALPIAALALLAWVYVRQIDRLLELSSATQQSSLLIAVSTTTLRLAVDMESGIRGYAVTGDPKFLAPYEKAQERMPAQFRRLVDLSADDEAQRTRAESLSHVFMEWKILTEGVSRRVWLSQPRRRLLYMRTSDRLMNELRAGFNSLIQAEARQRDERRERTVRITSEVMRVSLPVALAAGLILGLWSWRMIRAIASAYERALADREAAELAVRRSHDELEAKVEERTAELRASNAELEAFCHSVSHDLRAPLRGIDGFSLALAEDHGDRLPPEAERQLGFIREGVQRMGRLIDDLLALSRITRTELRRSEVDLSTLAEDSIARLRAIEPTRAVRVSIAPGLRAAGDPGLIAAALDNLLGNAWKFTGRTPDPVIEFGRDESAEPPSFFVRDNGAGFDMAYAHKLFGAFQRLHSTREFEGTGIGLATVRRIVARHGGRTWADGEPGRGATFHFTLPA